MSSERLPEPAHRHRLTEAFRRYGVLTDGRVSDVAVDSSRTTILSQIIRLRLIYNGGAPDAPRSVIFKTGHPDRVRDGWSGGRHEVAFYTQAASAMPGRLAPRCFEARSDEETKTWHIVLEDLSEST